MKLKLILLTVLLLLAGCVIDESATGSSTFRAGEICNPSQSQSQYVTDVYWTIEGKGIGASSAKGAVSGAKAFIASSPCHKIGVVYQLPAAIGIDDSEKLFNFVGSNKNIPDRILVVSFDRMEITGKNNYPKFIAQYIELSFDSSLFDLSAFKKVAEYNMSYKGEGYLMLSKAKAFTEATHKALEITFKSAIHGSGG